jgi:hypothetical protein
MPSSHNLRHGCSSETWALKHFKRWYFWATHSRLQPFIKLAKMLKAHLANILTYLRIRLVDAEHAHDLGDVALRPIRRHGEVNEELLDVRDRAANGGHASEA